LVIGICLIFGVSISHYQSRRGREKSPQGITKAGLSGVGYLLSTGSVLRETILGEWLRHTSDSKNKKSADKVSRLGQWASNETVDQNSFIATM